MYFLVKSLKRRLDQLDPLLNVPQMCHGAKTRTAGDGFRLSTLADPLRQVAKFPWPTFTDRGQVWLDSPPA